MAEIHLQAVIALIWVPLYLFLAVYYLVFHFRDRLRHHLLFSFLWFCWAIYALGSGGLYAADSPLEGVQWQRVQLLGAIFAYPTIFLFMMRQCGLPWRDWIAASLFGTSTLFSLANFTSPHFFSSQPAVKQYLFMGYQVQYLECEPGWIGVVCLSWGVILLLATLGLGVLAVRRRIRGSRPLLLGLTVVGLCSLHDSLLGLGLITSVYLVEHGFVVFAFTAAYFMQDQTLSAQHKLWHKTQQLLKANKELKGLDNLKEQLLANVSHELRTPLVSIRGYTEYMREGKMGPITPQQREGLEISLRSVDRLLALINNLLDYAKLRDGRVVLEAMPMDLVPVLSEALVAAEPLATARGLTLTRAYDPSRGLTLMGDGNKMRQVLDNLLSNAIKASREAGEVRVEAGAGEGWIWLAVVDQGQGIPEGKLERIFDRFYQLEQPGDRRSQGTGIGLSLVRDLVEMHSGELVVQSVEGQGARFEVRLPELASEGTQVSSTPRVTPQAAPLRGRSSRILLADDDEDIRDFLSMALIREGYTVVVAPDGQTALDRAQEGGHDLMVLDINMAGMSGLEVLDKLRASGGIGRSLPVFVITASRSDEVRLRCEELGCEGFLLKPFAMEALSALLKGVEPGDL